MKKLLGVALSVASIVLAAPATEAKAAKPSTSATVAASTAAPQWGRGSYNRRRGYVTTRSRLVRVGRRVYRETYQIRYLPNGATRVRLISRVRVR